MGARRTEACPSLEGVGGRRFGGRVAALTQDSLSGGGRGAVPVPVPVPRPCRFENALPGACGHENPGACGGSTECPAQGAGDGVDGEGPFAAASRFAQAISEGEQTAARQAGAVS